MQYQSWWSIEDLIAYGTNHAVCHVAKEYRPAKMAKAKAKHTRVISDATSTGSFITFLFASLDNYYTDLIREAYADKRKAAVFSLDTEIVKCRGVEMSLFDLMIYRQKHTRNSRTEASTVSRIDAEKAFMQVYALASAHLRKHLINWCVQPQVTKYKLTGKQFTAAISEFKEKRFAEVLTEELIRTIQNDAICRNRVCIATKRRFRTITREGQAPLEQVLNQAVLAYA